MQYLNYITDIFDKFYRETKIVLKITASVISFLLFGMLIIAVAGDLIYPDYDTQHYWISQIFEAINLIFKGSVFPIILFELLIHKEKSTS